MKQSYIVEFKDILIIYKDLISLINLVCLLLVDIDHISIEKCNCLTFQLLNMILQNLELFIDVNESIKSSSSQLFTLTFINLTKI
jgi:hypothetical protein